MNIKEIKLDFFPKNIIDAIIQNNKDSYINIEEVKEVKYIIKVNDKKYGLFNWDEEFTKEKIFSSPTLNYPLKNNIFCDLSFEQNIFKCKYLDENGNLIRYNENYISKSKYIYLINSSYKFNQSLIKNNLKIEQSNKLKNTNKIDLNNYEKFYSFFFDTFSNIIDLNFLLSTKTDFIVLRENLNISELPFQVLNNIFAKNNTLFIFSTKDYNNMNKSILNEIRSQELYLKDFLFVKEENFDFDSNLWKKNNLNKITFNEPDQLIHIFESYRNISILAHGYRKKDFSSLKIGKTFFNPFSLIECQQLPDILFLLSCMMNYSESENNFIYNLFNKGTKIIFGSPYITPIEYIEDIFNIMTANQSFTLFDKLIEIMNFSPSVSLLFKIMI